MSAFKSMPYDATQAMWLKEANARFSRILMYDGLSPTQIVREWIVEADQISVFPERLDFTADADGHIVLRELSGTQDVARYCINPQVDHKQLPGLWVGNQITVEKRTLETGAVVYVLSQTLTRVHCAGHSARYDAESQSVKIDYTVAPNDGSNWYDANGDIPYYSAKDLLKMLRCTSEEEKRPWVQYKEGFPLDLNITLTWRDFSLESRAALDALSLGDLREVVEAHGMDASAIVGGLVVHDSKTNALVYKIVLQLRDVYEPTTISELLRLPYRIKDCRRETLNIHEWNPNTTGEGYMVSCVVMFEHIKDTQAQRDLLAFPNDNEVLSELTGMSVFTNYPPVLGTPDISTWVFDFSSWWRVFRYEVVEEQDGLLSFRIHLQHPSWPNTFGENPSVTTRGVEGELGDSYSTLINGVPQVRKDEIDPRPIDGRYKRVSQSTSVTSQGEAKISSQFVRQFTYTDLHGEEHKFTQTGDLTDYEKDFPKGTIDYEGFSAPEISINRPHEVVVGSDYRTPSTGDNHSAVDVSDMGTARNCNKRANARIVYTNVKQEAVSQLLTLAKQDMRVNGYMVTQVTQTVNAQGLVTIVVSGANSDAYSYSYSYTVKRGDKTGRVTVIKMFNQTQIVDIAANPDYEGFVVAGYEVEPRWELNELCLYDGVITISPDWSKDGGWLYAFDERQWTEHETITENSTVWPHEQSTGVAYPANGRYFVRTIHIEYDCYLTNDTNQADSFFTRHNGQEKPGSTCQSLNNGRAFLVRVANRTEGEWE